LGLAHTQSNGVFQDIPNAQTRETPYIQQHQFGAAFALRWMAIMGNRLKTTKYARRSSASIVQLSIAGTVARLFFSPESTYSVLPIPQRLTLKHASTAARRAKSGHHMRGSRLYFQHWTSGANRITLLKLSVTQTMISRWEWKPNGT